MQKVRRHSLILADRAPTVCKRPVSDLFHSPFGVLFTFPSRYLFAIGLSVVFSLAGWCRLVHTGFLRSRATQDLRWPKTHSGYGAITPCGPPSQDGSPMRSFAVCGSFNPARASTPAVWALPLSLAATRGVTFCFPFLRLLRCFSSSGSPPALQDGRPPDGRVSPFGHPRITGRSRLPAAFRSLPRPSSPPGAKASPVRLTVLVAYRACPADLAANGTLEYPRSYFFLLELVDCFLCLSFHPVKEHCPCRLGAARAPLPPYRTVWRARDSNP